MPYIKAKGKLQHTETKQRMKNPVIIVQSKPKGHSVHPMAKVMEEFSGVLSISQYMYWQNKYCPLVNNRVLCYLLLPFVSF